MTPLRTGSPQRIWGAGRGSVHWIIACVRGFVVRVVAPHRMTVAVRENARAKNVVLRLIPGQGLVITAPVGLPPSTPGSRALRWRTSNCTGVTPMIVRIFSGR